MLIGAGPMRNAFKASIPPIAVDILPRAKFPRTQLSYTTVWTPSLIMLAIVPGHCHPARG